ncbi:MAG: hypothetical protein ACFB0C_24095 [Leptolyngbyaceae cyanobacterium]|mgnify:CR=1 FL=1
MADALPIQRLENYTLRHSQEVLWVKAVIAGEPSEILVFRGFSSSLTGATAFDPDVPVLPSEATITSIDRLQGPYRPDAPQYLEQDLSWPTFASRLSDAGL